MMVRGCASLLLLGVLLLCACCCSGMPQHSEEASTSASPHRPTTIIEKLRDVSEEKDEDSDNAAAEELDGETASPAATSRSAEDDDADEHDDYVERSGEQGSRSAPGALDFSILQVELEGDYDEDDWPEFLPLPAAQKKENAYKREKDGAYVILDENGDECVLAIFTPNITVNYPVQSEGDKTKYKKIVQVPPKDTTLNGACERATRKAFIEVIWGLGTFRMDFAYDLTNDNWFVGRFQFAFNSGKKVFRDSSTDEEVTMRNPAKKTWMTSHGYSFSCKVLHDIVLKSEDERFSGQVHFDMVRVQAFTVGDNFKRPKQCVHRGKRNEQVPLIVGCTLVALTALTIGVYGAIRYFKIKKVQYDSVQ